MGTHEFESMSLVMTCWEGDGLSPFWLYVQGVAMDSDARFMAAFTQEEIAEAVPSLRDTITDAGTTSLLIMEHLSCTGDRDIPGMKGDSQQGFRLVTE